MASSITQAPWADTETLESIRLQMLKFATLQLQDSHSAEDAVQEALLAALENAHKFKGQSAFKTWMFGILKYKILDIMRSHKKLASIGNKSDSEDDNGSDIETLFDQHGHWHSDASPAELNRPEAELEQKHFWMVFETCLNNLPGQQGRLFMMREYLELESNEICQQTEVTVSNLNTTLYRARLRLQKCLQIKWQDDADAAPNNRRAA